MPRPKGSKNKPRLHLASQQADAVKKPTAAQRMEAMKYRVALCVSDGMDESSIAEILNTTIEKLKAVFGRELRFGREIVRDKELQRLNAASAEGNVAASKAILATAGGVEKPAEPKPAADKNDNAKITRMALSVLNGGKK
jgi:hypothetical protein